MPAQQANHRSRGDDAQDDRRSFLMNLPLSIKMYTYYGEPQFFDILDAEYALLNSSGTGSEFLLFHASEKTINTIMHPQSSRCIAKFCSSFDTQEQLLLVKIPCSLHTAACAEMHDMIKKSLVPMGLSSAVQGYPRAIVRSSPIDTRGKQPDYCWGPKNKPPDPLSTPSVTFEVAYSESDSKLTSDARFWLSPGHGNANMCLTLQINRSRPEIKIKQWRKSSKARIKCSQIIWITKKGQTLDFSGHPLTIPFEGLFRRKSSRPEEGDLVISESRLKEMAIMIWQKQGW
ncbi:hypothetical protein N7509_008623 [Penicillium cosmopolitanum]|uniref:Uncharacterized protein n=1 Tax=Penicillium cosmopolitanum TaxID=1131564 RepID=A0A9W9VMZ7_9EURO|nr:uncharacterized protein N7509_008623 [Penicillium cosmopolitanum]KAJ5386082.1 hypothetical protein N7509_008623 [Penicillium cosmopolitanum]